MNIITLPEQRGHGLNRLGRHVEHDPLSKHFPFAATAAAVEPVSVTHRRYGIFNQEDLGACTGMAAVGVLNSDPNRKAGTKLHTVKDAKDVYSLATQLDEVAGSWPPDDTGSSGLAAAKALHQKGWISSYRWAFSIDEAIQALIVGPVITGVRWYEGFDRPDARGLVKIDGEVRGGHEFEVVGLHRVRSLLDSLVLCVNSWGVDWGVNGRFRMTVRTWETLLEQQGDVTVLVP